MQGDQTDEQSIIDNRSTVRSQVRIGNIFYLLAILALPVAMIASYFVYGLPVVYADDFDFYPVIEHTHAGHLTFMDIWAQHSEHRMLFPNIFFVLIYKLYAWNNCAICWVTHLIAVLALITLAQLAKTTLPQKILLPTLVILSLLCFSPIQSFNWLLGFQLQWLLTTLSVCLVALIFGTMKDEFRAVLLAAIPATIASYSLASGLTVWECVIAALIFSRFSWDRKSIAGWVGVGVLVTCGYFIGWKPLFQNDPNFWHHHLDIFGEYIIAYLGSPFAFDIEAGTSMVFGLFGLALFAGLMIGAWRLRHDEAIDLSAKLFPWIILVMFGLANAVVTGIGRDVYGPQPALSSRYVTMANFFWYGMAGVVAVTLPEIMKRLPSSRKVVATVALSAIGLLLAGCLAGTIVIGFKNYQSFATYLDIRLIAEIENQKAPMELLSDTYAGRPLLLIQMIESMKETRQGPFVTDDIPKAVEEYVNGIGLYQQGQYTRAVAEFQAAEPALSGVAMEHYRLGKSYYAIGQTELAQEEHTKAVELFQPYSKIAYSSDH